MQSNASSQSSARGISAMGVATFIAVIAVIIVITLSSLRGLAMRENESHAQALLRALGESLNREVLAAPPANLLELTESDPRLAPELTDTRWSGELLFRHGYLVELKPASDSQSQSLIAWPSHHGRTGQRAFTWDPLNGLTAIPSQGTPFSGYEKRP